MGLVLALAGCGGSRADDDDEGCDPACEAKIHFVGNIGIPADIDHFTYEMCADFEECVDFEIDVPPEEVTVSEGEDPSVTVTVTRTNEDYYEDLQGIFAFDGTWTSTTVKLEDGNFVGVSTTRPDGGNIALTARTLDEEETLGRCGCLTVELDI